MFAYPGVSGKTARAQKAIYKHAIARAELKGNRSDGTPAEDYYILRKTSMPANLTECGFMDSATDIKYILGPKWSKKIALGIAEGICKVFGGKVEEEKKKAGKVMPAKSFKGTFAGLYEVTSADLKLRAGANTKYTVLDSIPKGETVRCYAIIQRKQMVQYGYM